jgi:hypothetical protein
MPTPPPPHENPEPALAPAGQDALRPKGDEPLRLEDEDRDHDEEREQLRVARELQREGGLERGRERPEDEAAERSRRQAAETADDAANEGDEQWRRPHCRRDRPASHDEEEGRDAGEDAGDRERSDDDAVRADAGELRHAEVLGGRAKLDAEHRLLEEQRHAEHERDRHDGGEDRQARDQDATDVDRLPENRIRRDALRRSAPNRHPRDLLEPVAHCERCDEERHRRGASQGPEGEALLQEGEHGHDPNRGDDEHRPRLVAREIHRVPADHDQLAVGEIHETHHAKEEREGERHQGEHGPVADRVDGVLDPLSYRWPPIVNPR